jgi:hypothetical protein
MLDETLNDGQTREEWSASICSLVASELAQGTRLGVLTASEASQLTTRFLLLLEQALDLPSLRPHLSSLNPWECVRYRLSGG